MFFFWITFYGHPVGDGEVGLSRKEIGNSKNQLICVFIFWYFKPLSTHRTSKLSLYKYIYIYLSPSELTQPRTSLYKGIYIYIITFLLQWPCWSYGGGSISQKGDEFKNRVHMFFYLRYIKLFCTHTTWNFSIHS